MMFAVLLAMTAHQASPDWATLSPLPYRTQPVVTASMQLFVAREARARRCPLPPATGKLQTLTVELAVLVDGNGEVRTVVPRAIDCATVEQYAAGLVSGFARGNLLGAGSGAEQWYKTSLTFSWRK